MSIYNSETGEERYDGCVVALGEHNWYDDSDFYATVWDEAEQTFKSEMYASTRFYCTTGARIDASEDLMEAYRLWQRHAERVASVEARWGRRASLIALARECRMASYIPLRDLSMVYNGERFDACIKLLKTKRFRSEFRKSLSDQLRGWLETPEDSREHATPFSPRQMQYLY